MAKDVQGLAAYISANLATENAQNSLRPYLAALNAAHPTNKKFIPISREDLTELVAPAFDALEAANKLQQFDILTRGETFDASKPAHRAAMISVLTGTGTIATARAAVTAAVQVTETVAEGFGYGPTISLPELGEVLREVPESYISRYLGGQ